MRRAISLCLVIAATALGAAGHAAAAPPPASPECRVIEAVGVGPGEWVSVAPASDSAFLADQLQHVARTLGLNEADTAIIRARARAEAASYSPACWGEIVGRPDRFQTQAAFTRPIFLSSEMAVVQVRRDQHDRGATWTCAVRRQGATWRANCQQTMIWAR